MHDRATADYSSSSRVNQRRPGAPVDIVKERIPAASDTDTLTEQTVKKMCEYIQLAGKADDQVGQWSRVAVDRYSPAPHEPIYGRDRRPLARPELSASDLRGLVWSIFWMLKHAVRYQRDEPQLFRMGDGAALDLLTAPAVLVRQDAPAEDCDGFTMLACAMLLALDVGIEPYIVTIAADPSDRTRWSHVFAIAKLPSGDLVPVDASHGGYPGWIVPAEHTFRWQAWDMNGNRASLPAPRHSGLHGYTRSGRLMGMGAVGGLGDCDPFGSGDISTCPGTPGSGGGGCYVGMTDPSTGDTVASCGGGYTPPSVPPTSSPTKPTDWGAIFQNAINSATRVAQTAFLPSGVTTRLPNGQIVTNTGSYGAQALSPGLGSSSLLPLLGIGLLAVFAIGAMGKNK